MKKIALVILLLSIAVYGCKGKTDSRNEAVNSDGPKRTKMQLNVDLGEQKRLQDAADNGSQAWRKEAVDVAHAALINQGINAKLEECKLSEDHNAHSVVNAKCKDGEFNITLKRLVRPDGIWTATDMELVGEYKGLGAPAGHDHGSMDHGHGDTPRNDETGAAPKGHDSPHGH